ncbi:MAG: TIGR02186 family protein [Syntrophobacteraceae bacterium]
MKPHRHLCYYLFGLIGLLLLPVFSARAMAAPDATQFSVEPATIHMDTFYDGTKLVATGTVPEGSQAVLRFIGNACELHMKRKGKIFGLLWMNRDSLTFNGLPNLCIISSAVNLSELKGQEPGAGGLGGYKLSGLKEGANIEPNDADSAEAFEEFIRLKQNEGLYRETVGNVAYEPGDAGFKKFRAEIPVPSRMSPGQYRVELAAIKDGSIIAKSSQPVTADLVGFPAILAGLAFGRPALYGILASIIAIISGLLIGMVFQSKGAH